MIQSVQFISKNEAQWRQPNSRTAMISIVSPTEARHLKPGWKHRLDLTFDDIDELRDGYDLFTDEQANQIILFLKSLPDTVTDVVVHCHAGISRSAAVAKFVDEIYDLGIFPRGYSLYNKLVYSKLRNAYYSGG